MGGACVALATGAFLWAYGTHKTELFLPMAIAGATYAFAAVTAAVSFVRLYTKEKM
jgi:hypothetical protein